jgi:hypothetical protein
MKSVYSAIVVIEQLNYRDVIYCCIANRTKPPKLAQLEGWQRRQSSATSLTFRFLD